MGFGFLGAWSIGIPFLLVGAVMAVFGLFKLWIRGAWAITLGLGGVPVAIFARDVVGATISSAPPCSREGSATIPASAGEGASVSCTTPISEEVVVGLMFFGAIALSGVMWRLFLQGRSS
jgi:hypothetical protein